MSDTLDPLNPDLDKPEKAIGDKMTPDDLWETWQTDILNKFRDGCSCIEVRAFMFEMMSAMEDPTTGKDYSIKKSSWGKQRFNLWRETFPEFGELISLGLDLSEAHWMKDGREGTKYYQDKESPRMDGKMYTWNMRNRFKGQYSDSDSHLTLKNDPDGVPTQIRVQLDPEDAAEAYFELLERANKAVDTTKIRPHSHKGKPDYEPTR